MCARSAHYFSFGALGAATGDRAADRDRRDRGGRRLDGVLDHRR
jgi:hypothetical protein